MKDTPVSAHPDLALAALAETESVAGANVPWLEGALLRFLTIGSVLDIKAPDDPYSGPVLPNATVMTTTQPGETVGGSPPSAERYDAVFSRGALALAENPEATLAAWFRMVRPNGYLVIVMPQDEVADIRPAFGGDAAVGSADALMQVVEAALPAGGFRVVHLDAAPVRQPEGSNEAAEREIRMVLRAVAHGSSQPGGVAAAAPGEADGIVRPVAEPVIPFSLTGPIALKAPGMRADGSLLIRDFGPSPATVTRILVFKLDHHGDFVIGLPALRELRQVFPAAHIRMVCGRWNEATARSSGLVDDVRCFDYFPERAVDHDGKGPPPDWDRFAAATAGHFNLAIDLRVDEDSRDLLARVDAEMRCGIGSQAKFPMLDIALPDVSRQPVQAVDASVRYNPENPDGSQILPPDAFQSDMEIKTQTFHEASFTLTARQLLRSKNIFLRPGRYSAEFDLSVRGFVPGLQAFGVGIEVMADGNERLASRVFGRRNIRTLSRREATLQFETVGDTTFYDFRAYTSGKALRGRLRFGGIHLHRLDALVARVRPSELHVGEKLSLLVELIRLRSLAPRAVEAPATGARLSDGLREIVISPFSNSSVRDWPIGHYATLMGLLIEQFDCHVTMIGSPAQATRATALMDLLNGDQSRGRVSDQVGKTSWADLPDILRAADLVICNNSGIAHQSASLGVCTLAIYSGSHQPLEWGPRGPRSRAIMASVPCSPCGYERLEDCGNDHLCMQLITPRVVLDQVARMLANADENAEPTQADKQTVAGAA